MHLAEQIEGNGATLGIVELHGDVRIFLPIGMQNEREITGQFFPIEIKLQIALSERSGGGNVPPSVSDRSAALPHLL